MFKAPGLVRVGKRLRCSSEISPYKREERLPQLPLCFHLRWASWQRIIRGVAGIPKATEITVEGASLEFAPAGRKHCLSFSVASSVEIQLLKVGGLVRTTFVFIMLKLGVSSGV